MAKSYHHLTLAERTLLETQLTLGMRPAAIAVELLRSRSTITREIRRNGPGAIDPSGGDGRYRSLPADGKACRRASRPRVPRRLQSGCRLWEAVLDYLRRGLSPEQIERTLAGMPEPVQLSYETIYTALYAMPRGELRASVLGLLRRGHKTRRCRASGRDRRNRNKAIPDMVLIDQRPGEVAMRLIPGHWEGDLIVGKRNRSQVGTLVERTTLFLALVQLDNARAPTAARAFTRILNRFDSQMRRSLTCDQGTEMARHKTITANTGVKVCFAHPHAPWERGICENINGLIRQYLPRGTDLSLFSRNQLDDIAWMLNTRPRKTLGWKAPAELFLPPGAFDFVQHWSTKIIPVALGP